MNVLCYEHGEPCKWFDTDIDRWRDGNIVGNRIFYNMESAAARKETGLDHCQVFVIAYWNEERDRQDFIVVKREELQLSAD